MKITKPFWSVVALFSCLFAARAQAEDERIIYRASEKKNPYAAAVEATDTLTAGSYQAVTRAVTDGNVYRHEGRASARHDEISSRGIFVHIALDHPGTIYAGHSLAR